MIDNFKQIKSLFVKYLVKTRCLEWHYIGYIVEEDSEEEARELAKCSEGDVYYDDYDITNQVDIESIKEYED